QLDFPRSYASLPFQWNEGFNLESIRNNFQVEREYREDFLRRTAQFSHLLTKENESRVSSIRAASEKARSEREKSEKETIDKAA
ncbi:hypothetical protein PENTCL1PPCAC_26091, partial [Pristionchus entomophagus]